MLVACNSTAPDSATTDTVAQAATATTEPTATPPPTATPEPTATPAPTDTPAPTSTVTPTNTPPPTATPIPTDTPAPTATATATEAPTETPTPAPPAPAPIPPAPPVLARVPGNPTPYLETFRMIAYYGSPYGRGLGILGNQPRNETVRLLHGVIRDYAPYNTDGRTLIPTFHMITTVAKPAPGPLGTYNVHVESSFIWDWHVTARNNNAAIILEIQPGRASLLDELDRVREFLYEPHTHLGIDPEFTMLEGQVPGQQVGTIDAAEINLIQAELNQIALELGVRKVLILHQFKDSMITNKWDIINYPHVELVIDGDGFGAPGPKISNYQQYAAEGGFEYGGFKLFPDHGDSPVMTPEEVMWLSPAPAVIIYQ